MCVCVSIQVSKMAEKESLSGSKVIYVETLLYQGHGELQARATELPPCMAPALRARRPRLSYLKKKEAGLHFPAARKPGSFLSSLPFCSVCPFLPCLCSLLLFPILPCLVPLCPPELFPFPFLLLLLFSRSFVPLYPVSILRSLFGSASYIPVAIKLFWQQTLS